MNITKQEFEKLYYELTDKELAKILGVKARKSIRRYAKTLNLRLKGRGYVPNRDKRKIKKVNFIDN